MHSYGGQQRQMLVTIILLAVFCVLWKQLLPNFYHRAEPTGIAQRKNPAVELPIRDVVLMCQFNYDTPFDSVRDWARIWAKFFAHIVVAGPFSVATQEQLASAGIQFTVGSNDRGFVSPYENLLNTMLDYSKPITNMGSGPSSSLNDTPQQQPPKAVLYLHDDALLNITRLYNGREALPANSIIRTMRTFFNHFSYSIHVEVERRLPENNNDNSQEELAAAAATTKVIPDSFVFEHRDENGNPTRHRDLKSLIRALPPWDNWDMCLEPQVKMLSTYGDWWEDFSDDSNITTTTTESAKGSSPSHHRISYRFSFPMKGQSDFLYVPLAYTEILERAARPHIQNKVFLECAVPTIVHWLLSRAQKAGGMDRGPTTSSSSTGSRDAPTAVRTPTRPPADEYVPLCTEWDDSVRGSYRMLLNCLRPSSTATQEWGVVHPVKLGKVGPANFSAGLDLLQGTTAWNISH